MMLVSQIEGNVCKYMTSFRVCFVKWGWIAHLYLRSNFCIRNSRYHSAEGCQILEHTHSSRNKWRASHLNFKTALCITNTCPGCVYIFHTSGNLHKLFCIFNLSEIVLSHWIWGFSTFPPVPASKCWDSTSSQATTTYFPIYHHPVIRQSDGSHFFWKSITGTLKNI